MKRNKFVDLKNAFIFNKRTDFLEYFFKSNAEMEVIDVGNLGDGEIKVDVKKIVEKNNGEYFGLDSNENLAKKLEIKNQIIGDLHNLSGVINDEQFDCIYAGQIIEHTWRPAEMIKECNRILKKGGYLVLDTPHALNVWSIIRLYFLKRDTLGMDDNYLVYNEAKDEMKKIRNEEKEVLTQPQHKIFYSAAMLRQLLNMNGFKVEYFSFIKQPNNWWHRLFMKIFPLSANKIGVVAKKEDLEIIFDIKK
jgi:ubiquinone/menaquinone biosynthesis C-methylase UbiE